MFQYTEQKKKAGSLPSFDPSSHTIHPASRVRVVLRLHGSRSKAKEKSRSKSRTDSPLSDLDSEDDEDEGESELEEDSDGSLVPTRRSTRNARTSAQDNSGLPFSPRKTRARAIYISDDEDDDDADPLLIATSPVRRSTRSKRAVQRDYVEGDEDDDDYAPTPQAKGTKKKAQPKASRPAYGRIRPMEDLKYDPDPETKALRAHRSKCEKCQREPTPQLKKKRKIDDEEADELGGWVQWYFTRWVFARCTNRLYRIA